MKLSLFLNFFLHSDEANTEIAQRSIEASFEKYTENKEALQTSSLKSILKILKKVEKKPSDVRSRRLQLGNVVVKKFITNVKGGPELISACGFQLVEDNKKKSSSYFLKDVNLQIIKLGIQLVSQRIEDLKSGNAVKAIIKQSTRVMCPCGFWGNIDQEGLCSVCYQKKVFGPPEKNTAKKVALKSPRPKNDRRIRLKKALLKLKALYRFKLGVKTESRVVQKNKKRCFSCNRKVGYLGFECRCLYVFCDVHRFPDTHCCTFDYKKFNQSKLKKENKQVIHEKLERID